MSQPVGLVRVVLTLLWAHSLRGLRRWFNLLVGRRDVRAATARKGSGGWVLPAVMTLFTLGYVIGTFVVTMSSLKALFPAPGGALHPTACGVLILLAILMAATILAAELTARNLAYPDWDLEWLGALPISTDQILAFRLVDRAVPLRASGITLSGLFLVVAANARWGLWTPLAVLGALTPLLLWTGAIYTPLELLVRLRLSPRVRRWVGALLTSTSTICGMGMIYLVITIVDATDPSRFAWAADLPAVVWSSPPGLALRCLAEPHPDRALELMLSLCGHALALAFAGVKLSSWMLSGGLGTGALQEAGSRAAVQDTRELAPRRVLSVYEARLLTKARRELGTTIGGLVLLVPLALMFGGSALRQWIHEPRLAAFIAATAVTIAIIPAGQMAMASEGHAIWLLMCTPWPLARVLLLATRMLAAIAVALTALVYASCVAFGMPLTVHLALSFAATSIGAVFLCGIAVAVGAIECDPFSDLPGHRISPQMAALLNGLAQGFMFSLMFSPPWSVDVQLVLLCMIWFACWQQAMEYLPFVLDPVTSPPRRVSVATALYSAYAFLLIQTLFLVVNKSSVPNSLLGFTIAGAIVVCCCRFVFWKYEIAGAPTYLGGRVSALRQGLRMGIFAAAAGVLWLTAVTTVPYLREHYILHDITAHERLAYAFLAIVLAPLFEEYIFRGLLFEGLRRSMSFPRAALASALLFAAIHPPMSFPAVFALGLACAHARERSGALAAPVITHAFYNAMVVIGELLT